MSDRSPSSRDALDPIGDDDLPRHKRLKKWLRLEAKCPNCGVQAKVRVDRLNQKFRCKRCGTAMYFDRSGKWKLGLPPADTDDIGELAEREQWWNKFPQLKKVAIGGLLLVVLFLV
ncbi:MAG: hypothetical protein KDA80_07455, partial [Planctomycetaceae bacterium]|nr:hypothetical protein [Planctomycetaceae bacterium]